MKHRSDDEKEPGALIRRVDLSDETPSSYAHSHNAELSIVVWIFAFLFSLLIIRLIYINVVERESLQGNINNTKADTNSSDVIRGDIVTEGGVLLATTNLDEYGNQIRSYPYDNIYAHVIGYAVSGKSGIEAEENYDLLTSHSSLLKQISASENGNMVQGDEVVVTLDSELQQAAYYALGQYNGAIVVMEPDTGKILAMVSKPDFNPNTISEEWESLVSDTSSSVLLNRATQGLYPPGSTFKMVTTLAFLRQHPYDYADYLWECSGSYTDSDVTITCYGGQSHGQEDISAAFANSCNTVFARIGLDLDNQDFKDTAEDFLFNKSLPVTWQYSQSVFTLTDDSSIGEQMTTAIGQGDTLATPLHMALITSTIANGGIMMRPYLIDHIETSDGKIVSSNEPSIYKRIMTADEAGLITDYMIDVVTSGTATALYGNGYSVAGKTGSAEYESDLASGTHSWFCGFAETDQPHICIVVIAEDGGTGSSTAVPIAKQVLDTYFYG